MSNPTRKHCIEQLEKILSAIFTAASTSNSTNEGSAPALTTVSPEKARDYAEAVERELFTHNSEPDAKGVLTHSKKYTAKFRTLHFNLKSNEYFRSRVASGNLDASGIYNMNQEDLLSPEVRAEQELEKAKLLAQSVKTEIEKPKTKLTHKGEEILDEFDNDDSRNNSGNNGNREQERRESMSVITGDTPYMPNDGFEAFSDRERSMSLAGSPRLGDSPRFGSPSAVFADSPSGRAYSPVVESPRGQSTLDLSDKPSSTSLPEPSEQDEFVRPALPHHARSDSQSKVKLDLDAVWSNLKPAPASASPEKEDPEGKSGESGKAKDNKEEDDMDTESDNEGSSDDKKQEDAKVNEEYDPFATDAREKSNADEDFDALMGGNEASQDSMKKESKAQLEMAPPSPSDVADEIASLPSVWEGTISLVDEGNFPARLVQVGGTPFGPHPSIWERVLPKSKIEITGRIDEKAASEYVVQSNFSQSRENIVLAILPHLEKDSLSSPESQAIDEKTEAMYSKLIAMYSDRKRYGVAPPSTEFRKVTRDHYIVPLRKDAALPDYVELLDSHTLPEKGHRKRDYLLSVLVLQKGLGLNTTHRSSTSGGSTPQSSQDKSSGIANNQNRSQLHPPLHSAGSSYMSPLGQPGVSTQTPGFSSHMSPPYQPPAIPSQAQMPNQPATGAGLPSLDPAALQSLLSNPSLLQALSASGQQGSPPHPSGTPYGAFSPPQPGITNSGYNASGIPGISGGIPSAAPAMPAWSTPPVPQQQGYPPFPPPLTQAGQWNPAGSPPWQGGQQPPMGGPAAWNAPPQQNHPPGYIDPERIKAASAEARLIAERDRQEKLRSGGGGPSSYGGGGASGGRSGRDGNRDRNEHRGGRDRGFGGDDRRGGRGDRHGNGRKGDSSGSGINQMQAGIQDRGWGRRG